MTRALLRLLLFLVAVYAFYAWQVWRVQRAQLFPGTALRAEAVPAGAARVALRASFGRVDLVWMPAPGTQPAGAIVYRGAHVTRARVPFVDALFRVHVRAWLEDPAFVAALNGGAR